MQIADDNERLVRVGPKTPMGDMMRRYWTPVCTSAQLPVPDGRPLRTRLFGENFVAFRDSAGQVGLLDEYCMHRRVSLALGRVEKGGIRCLYHGWKFGVDGTIQETPNYCNPEYRARFKAPAYPAREAGGLVWAYLGPAEKEPPFPHYRFMDGPAANRVVLRCDTKVNYLQLFEGGVDSSHVGVLHADHVQINDKDVLSEEEDFDLGVMAVDDHAPDLDIEDADYGYYYAAKRAGPPTAEGEETHSIRVTAVIFPTGRIIPAPGSFHYYLLEVPQDDENTATYVICHGLEKADHDAVVEILGLHDARFWNERDCVFTASWADHMGQDRARMDAGQSFAGFSGIEQEDMVLALSMGPIVDRSLEHLVPADRAVVHLRRRLLESARRVEAGGDPIGLSVVDYSRIAPLIDTTLPRTARWQDLVPDNAVQPQIAAE